MYCAFMSPSQKKEGRPDASSTRVGPFNSEVSLHILNALDECQVLRSLFVPYRLNRGLELLLVSDVVHNCPRFDHLLERFLFAVVPKLTLLLLRLPGDLEDQRLVVLRQLVPDL